MIKINSVKHGILSIAIIVAVIAIVALISVSTTHACGYSGCGYGDYSYAPVYNYTGTYQYPVTQPSASPITATCFSQPISATVGTTVQWSSSVYGGNGTYNITWVGDEGLTGYGPSITKTYMSPGSKTASIRVVSGSQSVSMNCSNTINVMTGISSGNYNGGYSGYSGYNGYSGNTGYNGYSGYSNNNGSLNSYGNGYSNYNSNPTGYIYNSNPFGASSNNNGYNGYSGNNGYNSNYSQYNSYNPYSNSGYGSNNGYSGYVNHGNTGTYNYSTGTYTY